MGSSTIDQLGSRQFCSECGRPFAPEELVRFGAVAVCADCKPSYVQRIREGGATSTTVQYGGFWRRVLAVWLDAILLAIVTIPIRLMIGGTVASSIWGPRIALGGHGFWASYWTWFWGWGTVISYGIDLIYSVYFVSQKGATIGKMIMGLKVVTAGGSPLSVGRALGRHFARILSQLVLYIGFIMAAFDSEKRALHDHICSTRVIRD